MGLRGAIGLGGGANDCEATTGGGWLTNVPGRESPGNSSAGDHDGGEAGGRTVTGGGSSKNPSAPAHASTHMCTDGIGSLPDDPSALFLVIPGPSSICAPAGFTGSS